MTVAQPLTGSYCAVYGCSEYTSLSKRKSNLEKGEKQHNNHNKRLTKENNDNQTKHGWQGPGAVQTGKIMVRAANYKEKRERDFS